jgi:hypothetical protein
MTKRLQQGSADIARRVTLAMQSTGALSEIVTRSFAPLSFS